MPESILELLQPYIRTAYPDRSNVSVTRIQSMNSGWESDVYAFDATWGTPGAEQVEPLILRIYPGDDADAKSTREYHNLAQLRKAGYPVPRVDRLEPRDTSPFGRPFLIMERVPGSGMWGRMFNGAPEERERLLDLFCALFARLHALNTQPFDPSITPDQNAIRLQFSRWEPYVGSMPLPGFFPGWEWMNLRAREITSTTLSPCHWDFHPDNILLDASGSAVVIDWTGLEVTDRRFDVAWTLLLISSNEGIRVREPLIRGYERHAGMTLTDMDFFDAVACFRRLFSVLVSLAIGAEKMGMRSGAEEMMRMHVKPLQFIYERWLTLTRTPIPEAEAFLHESAR